MRRILALGIAGLLTTAGGMAAAATHHASRHHTVYGFTDSVVNRQATAWSTVRRNAPAKWRPIDWRFTGGAAGVGSSFRPLTVRAMGTLTVTVSVTVSGGPIDLRVFDNGVRRLARPGVVRFNPHTQTNSASYTFVHHGGHPACGRYIGVEWRRATDAPATLHKADAVVTYKQDTTYHGGVGCA